jgi:hypothetical protein
MSILRRCVSASIKGPRSTVRLVDYARRLLLSLGYHYGSYEIGVFIVRPFPHSICLVIWINWEVRCRNTSYNYPWGSLNGSSHFNQHRFNWTCRVLVNTPYPQIGRYSWGFYPNTLGFSHDDPCVLKEPSFPYKNIWRRKYSLNHAIIAVRFHH